VTLQLRAKLPCPRRSGSSARWLAECSKVLGLRDDILFSPVLRRVLGNATNFSLNPNSVILTRLNRAELGDFNALACGRLPESGDDLRSQLTLSRWENAPTLRQIIRLMDVMIEVYCASDARPPHAVTLDIDDTVDVVHRHQ
jgi:hypothetical protein